MNFATKVRMYNVICIKKFLVGTQSHFYVVVSLRTQSHFYVVVSLRKLRNVVSTQKKNNNSEAINVLLVSYKKQELITLREHLGSLPGFFVGSVLLIFSFFCPVMFLCVIYVFVCLQIVVSNVHYVVYFLCLSSSCVPHVAGFSRLSICDCPFDIL